MSQTILRFCLGGHLVKKGDGRCLRIAVDSNGQEVSKYNYGRNCSTQKTDYQVGILGGLRNPSIYNGFRIILYPDQNPKGNEYLLKDTGIYNGKFWRAYDAGEFGWKAVAISSLSEYLPGYDNSDIFFEVSKGPTGTEEIVDNDNYRPPRESTSLPIIPVVMGVIIVIAIIMFFRK